MNVAKLEETFRLSGTVPCVCRVRLGQHSVVMFYPVPLFFALQQDDTDFKLAMGDELRLRHSSAGKGGQEWSDTGTIIQLVKTTEEVVVEFRAKVRLIGFCFCFHKARRMQAYCFGFRIQGSFSLWSWFEARAAFSWPGATAVET